MTDFIKEQQELAASMFDGHINVDLQELVTTVITNIGKELLRRIEETDNTFSFTDSRYIKKDTMKQHITNVTGVYE